MLPHDELPHFSTAIAARRNDGKGERPPRVGRQNRSRSVTFGSIGCTALLGSLVMPVDGQVAGANAVSTHWSGVNPSTLVAMLATSPTSYGAAGWIDTTNRAQVIAAYESAFGLGAVGVDMQWNGDTSMCLPGTTSAEWRQSVINRINYYRAMAGVPAIVTESVDLSAMAQAAALSNAAETEQRLASGESIQGVISHALPTDRPCYSSVAGEAVAASNLFVGLTGPAAIDGYMVDPGPGNTSAGHRNWLLHPPSIHVGIGGVPALDSPGYANDVLYVAGPGFWDPNPALRRADGGVAWPAEGFMPGELLAPRWSFSLRGADFSGATVHVASNGSAIPVEVDHQSLAGHNYAPFASLVWVPDQARINTNPAIDTNYDVTITGVKVADVEQLIRYSVTIVGDTEASPVGPGAKSATPVATGASGDCGIAGYFVDSVLEEPCDGEGKSLPFGRCGSSEARYWDRSRVPVSDAFVQIFRLYCAGLGRFPDESGLEYWIDRATTGGLSLEQVAEHHLTSPEWASLDVDSEEKFVSELYRNVLGREAEVEGFAFWTARLNAGASSRAEVLLLFSESPEHIARTKTRTL